MSFQVDMLQLVGKRSGDLGVENIEVGAVDDLLDIGPLLFDGTSPLKARVRSPRGRAKCFKRVRLALWETRHTSKGFAMHLV